MTPERGGGDRFSRGGGGDEPGRSDQPRAGLLRRWPPVLWLLVYVGSIFILNGSNGKGNPLERALGIGLALIGVRAGGLSRAGTLAGAAAAARHRGAHRRRHRLLRHLRP